MRLTIPHYHHFGDQQEVVGGELPDPDSWDRLRLDADTMFSFDADPEDWERRVSADTFQERRARALVAWFDRLGYTEIASYGAGPALVERWIHRLRPKWTLRLTEYSPRTIERLHSHFPEAETSYHDLLSDPPLKAQIHVLCCLDTEFDDDQWRRIYAGFASVPILIYPCGTINLLGIVNELRQWMSTKRPTPCGYGRTKGRIEELAGATHQLERLDAGAGCAWLARPTGTAA